MDHSGIDAFLVRGCIREADRGEIVSLELDGLRDSLDKSFHTHMTATAEEIRFSSRLLRDFADRSQVHFGRVPVVLNCLNVVLPCLCRSLRDITAYYEDCSLSRERRWRTMYSKMTEEANGLPLPQRFMLYNQFLIMLVQLLTGSPEFDFSLLQDLGFRIIHLRKLRGIPEPTSVGPPIPRDTHPASAVRKVHWAETMFVTPPVSRTMMRGQKRSRSLGPDHPWGHVKIPADSHILFRHPFDNDKLSATVYANDQTETPHILLRTYRDSEPWFSLRGVHELGVLRNGSALKLTRWSRSVESKKLWAELYFATWEELVLFYCTFVSLKARDPFMMRMWPDECSLLGETLLFQAQIIDGTKHSLVVYKDVMTKGYRIQASVREGDLKHCPVWTAFVPHLVASSSWLVHKPAKSAHRVWLYGVHLHIFCQKYQEKHRRLDKSHAAFEIYFVSQEAPLEFKEVFKLARKDAAL